MQAICVNVDVLDTASRHVNRISNAHFRLVVLLPGLADVIFIIYHYGCTLFYTGGTLSLLRRGNMKLPIIG